MDVETAVLQLHLSTSGRDRAVIRCQRVVVNVFRLVRPEHFSCLPVMKERGVLIGCRGVYLSGPRSSGAVFCFGEKIDEFRSGPH